ncbi:homeobox protein Hox-C13-like [Leptonychotes weddellii]|uniref:Homeobox protein Hox-C13-like n=1 Tax=Leptonychotes weddellii TaxID=9713 RepID=A0A2U3Z621_LEPWE|nr:homeobox protein Hox-C13-like [Leptonychotes weddellii]
MTTSLLLHPRWPESLMYVYEDSAAESGSGGGGGGGGGAGGAGGGCRGASPGKAPSMDGLGSSCPASHCRDLLPHPVLGRPPAPLGAPQGAVYTDIPAPEAARQCAPPPAPPTSSSATLGYGYPFGGSYYGCRLSHNVNLQQKPCAYHPGDKYPEPSGALPGDDLSSRAKEFAFYPSFASSYQAMPGYLDVSVVPGISGHPEPRHDALIPVEGYQHWALSNGWDSQVYCPKEQSQSAHLWKSPFPGKEGARVPPPQQQQPGTPPRPACPGAPRLSHPRRLAPARRLCWAADGACRASCAEECAGEEICSDTFPGAARPRVKQSQAPERRAAGSARVGSSPPPPPARSSLTRGSWPPEARFQPGMGVGWALGALESETTRTKPSPPPPG